VTVNHPGSPSDRARIADLEYALAAAAGLIGPRTVTVATVHEIQVKPAGTIPLTGHDVLVDFVVTPERVIDARARPGGLAHPGVEQRASGRVE
jgi:5-formyltetrahydrofolate cyclo-ligase